MLNKTLSEYRIIFGLTQRQLAEKIGYTENHIAKVETAMTPPGPALRKKLMNVYQLTPLELEQLVVNTQISRGKEVDACKGSR